MSNRYRTPPNVVKRNAVLLVGAVSMTFVALRLSLFLWPNADLMLASYNVHHLFTGLLLIMLGGIPLAVFRGHTPRLDVALVVFGVGLGMALDEWVYLIATDGSNAAYLLPVSFWGGMIVIGIALMYAIVLAAYRLWHAAATEPAAGRRAAQWHWAEVRKDRQSSP